MIPVKMIISLIATSVALIFLRPAFGQESTDQSLQLGLNPVIIGTERAPTYSFTAPSSGLYRFHLEFEPDSNLGFDLGDGNFMTHFATFLDAETVTINISGTVGKRSEEVAWLSINFEPFMPNGEPNGRPSLAQTIQLNSPTSVSLYPFGETDWYGLEIPSAGNLLIIDIPISPADAPPLEIAILSGDTLTELTPSVGRTGNSYGPLVVEAGHIQLRIRGALENEIHELTTYLGVATASLDESENSSLARTPAVNIFMVGVQLDQETAAQLQATTEAIGGGFVNAAATEDLTGLVEDIHQVIASPSDDNGDLPWGITGLGLLIIIATAGLMIIRSFSRKSESTSGRRSGA